MVPSIKMKYFNKINHFKTNKGTRLYRNQIHSNGTDQFRDRNNIMDEQHVVRDTLRFLEIEANDQHLITAQKRGHLTLELLY